MGFRYRKSINLGGGFRINLSKSGIGYSWGVKGYRVTKTARGTTRRTASIPGTGISYVHETGKNNRGNSGRGSNPANQQPVQSIDNNHYDTQNIVNNVATAMVSEGLEDMLASASKALKLNKVSTIGLWITVIWGFGFPVMFLFAAAFLALKIYVKTKGSIDLDYSIDADQQSIVDERIKPMIKISSIKRLFPESLLRWNEDNKAFCEWTYEGGRKRFASSNRRTPYPLTYGPHFLCGAKWVLCQFGWYRRIYLLSLFFRDGIFVLFSK